MLAETAHKGRRGADIYRRMGNDGDGRMGGRELGRRFTDSAGSRRGHGGENAILRSHGREQPRMDSTGRRQRAGGREPRTAGAAGRTREQDSRGARQESRPDEDGGRSSGRHDFPLSSAQIHLSRYFNKVDIFDFVLLHKYICRGTCISSDNVSLQEQR